MNIEKIPQIPNCIGAEFRERVNKAIDTINLLIESQSDLPVRRARCKKCGRPLLHDLGTVSCSGCGYFIDIV